MIHTCIAFLLLFLAPKIQTAQDYEKNHCKKLTHFSQEKFDFLTQNSDVLDRYWKTDYKYTDFWHGSTPKDIAATCSLALMQQYGIPKDVITRLLGTIASYDYTFYPEQLFLQKLHTQPVCISINQEINDNFYPKRMISALLPNTTKDCSLVLLPLCHIDVAQDHWYFGTTSVKTNTSMFEKNHETIANRLCMIYQPPETNEMISLSPALLHRYTNQWIQSITAQYNEETNIYEYDVELKNNTKESVTVHIIADIMTLEYSKKDTEGKYLESKKVCIELPLLPNNFKPFNFNFINQHNPTPWARARVTAAACPISLNADYISIVIGDPTTVAPRFPIIISKHIMADLLQKDEPKLIPLAMIDLPARWTANFAARYFVGKTLKRIKFVIFWIGIYVIALGFFLAPLIILVIIPKYLHTNLNKLRAKL